MEMPSFELVNRNPQVVKVGSVLYYGCYVMQDSEDIIQIIIEPLKFSDKSANDDLISAFYQIDSDIQSQIFAISSNKKCYRLYSGLMHSEYEGFGCRYIKFQLMPHALKIINEYKSYLKEKTDIYTSITLVTFDAYNKTYSYEYLNESNKIENGVFNMFNQELLIIYKKEKEPYCVLLHIISRANKPNTCGNG
jgi:hypothetical protein